MRINRSNPEPSGAQQPAVQPQTAAPQQPAPRREEPRQEPPKPKKEKPKKRPEPEEYDAYEEDEEEKPRRRFPVGCLIVLVILALVGFGGDYHRAGGLLRVQHCHAAQGFRRYPV